MRNPLVQLKRRIILWSSEPPRSSRWPEVRRAHLEKEGWCRACGATKDLEVHHIEPFHLTPDRELDPSNLITLCERMFHQCHLRKGHLGSTRTSARRRPVLSPRDASQPQRL